MLALNTVANCSGKLQINQVQIVITFDEAKRHTVHLEEHVCRDPHDTASKVMC